MPAGQHPRVTARELREASRMDRVGTVAGARQGDERDPEARELIPDGREVRGPEHAQRRREGRRPDSEQLLPGALVDRRRLAGEDRLGVPQLGELRGVELLDALGEHRVGPTARLARRAVLDAGVTGDEHQARNAIGRAQRRRERDTGAERIAAKHQRTRRSGQRELRRLLVTGRLEAGRTAVPGQLECQRPIAFAIEMADELIPGTGAAGEAVDQDERGHGVDPTDRAASTYALLAAFVDELVRCGMRHACTSPGSRSAPLALSLARDERLACHPHIDERCASFFALGLARATATPVAVTCTSGTAAAQLHAAAIEAHESRVPLLLLTADRPAELRENGAGQAIDQIKLYGSSVKWFVEVELPPYGPAALRWIRTLACRAYWTAGEGRPGAVHLNFPLREPLVTDLPPDRTAGARPGGAPYVRRSTPVARPLQGALTEVLAGAERPVLVAGRGGFAAPLAGRLNWPMLADPLSGSRCGPAAIAHYDALLRDARFAQGMRPDLVLRVGDLPVSKPLRSWLAQLDVPQVSFDPDGAWQDPDSRLSESWAALPAGAVHELAGELEPRPPEWLARWRRADDAAGEALAALLDGGLSEPALARDLATVMPVGATLFVASSMPVRDVETTWPALDHPPRVLCNRGANGIDGIVSSAFGVAAVPAPVVLLIGDVALAHDIGGLAAARRLDLPLTIVVLDNAGGGIFDFLPLAQTPLAREGNGEGLYERHITTDPGLDLATVARLFDLDYVAVTARDELAAAVQESLAPPRATLIHVRTDRAENVALHGAMWRAVADAL